MYQCYITWEYGGGSNGMGGRTIERRVQRCGLRNNIALGAGMNIYYTRRQAEQETEGLRQPILWKGEALGLCPSGAWRLAHLACSSDPQHPKSRRAEA